MRPACFVQLRPSALVWLAGLGLAAAGSAQLVDPAEIVTLETTREVTVVSNADSESGPGESVFEGAGPFADLVHGAANGDLGSSSWGEAWQRTDISTFSIRGEGATSATASLGGDENAQVVSIAESTLSVTFTLTEDSPFALSATFEAADSPHDLSNAPRGSVSLFVVGPGRGFAAYSHTYIAGGTEPPTYTASGMIEAGSHVVFGVNVWARREGEGEPWDHLGEATARFEASLSFGDRDGDGLLDEWEEEGIDWTGAGIEIDLPAMGADPDHKDLFVEIDRMQGVQIDQQALDMVVAAFADAPAAMVQNPDGEDGINLHLVHQDGDVVPHTPFVAEELSSTMAALRDEYFGSPEQRAHAQSDEIRDVLGRIFRYSIWGDTHLLEGEHYGGQALTIPGADFVLAAGGTMDENMENATTALAAGFMHELGHSLGLRHGGQDDRNAKPNYLSVMNYAYAYPRWGEGEISDVLVSLWRLDYSRETMRPLQEFQLREADGLDGPAGRYVLFNAAAFDDPEPVRRFVAWANKVPMDWNANDVLDADEYKRDLNRRTADDELSFDILDSSSDWDRLVYPVPTGSARSVRGAVPAGPDLSFSELEAFFSVPSIDGISGGALIFEDDFEAGTPIPWSSRVGLYGSAR